MRMRMWSLPSQTVGPPDAHNANRLLKRSLALPHRAELCAKRVDVSDERRRLLADELELRVVDLHLLLVQRLDLSLPLGCADPRPRLLLSFHGPVHPTIFLDIAEHVFAHLHPTDPLRKIRTQSGARMSKRWRVTPTQTWDAPTGHAADQPVLRGPSDPTAPAHCMFATGTPPPHQAKEPLAKPKRGRPPATPRRCQTKTCVEGVASGIKILRIHLENTLRRTGLCTDAAMFLRHCEKYHPRKHFWNRFHAPACQSRPNLRNFGQIPTNFVQSGRSRSTSGRSGRTHRNHPQTTQTTCLERFSLVGLPNWTNVG